jgi:LacI family transcriptional regulator
MRAHTAVFAVDGGGRFCQQSARIITDQPLWMPNCRDRGIIPTFDRAKARRTRNSRTTKTIALGETRHVDSSAKITRRVTLADVAKMAGVSKQTASRVVNDSPNVTDDTRARVKQCIEALGFRPSALARQLNTGRSHTLGIVSNASMGYLVCGEAYVGMLRQTDKMGYALLNKLVTDFSPVNVTDLMDQLIERQVDGVIWAGPDIGDSHTWMDQYPMERLPMPMIAINTRPRPGIDVVGFDNFLGGQNATRHLLSLGRRKIAHISGPLDRWVASQRVEGWRAALDEAGLPECKQLFVEGDWETSGGAPGLRRLLEIDPKVDAIFVSSDRMALGVLLEAQRLGIRVPQDIAVMSIDNDPQSAFFNPPLTTMTQDTPAMAEAALCLLVRRICERHGEPYPALCAEQPPTAFAHELIVRGSTVAAE